MAEGKASSEKEAQWIKAQFKKKGVTHKQLFEASDKNENFRLSYGEFVRGIKKLGIRPMPSTEAILIVFDSYDVNQDGAISWKELGGKTISNIKKDVGKPDRPWKIGCTVRAIAGSKKDMFGTLRLWDPEKDKWIVDWGAAGGGARHVRFHT